MRLSSLLAALAALVPPAAAATQPAAPAQTTVQQEFDAATAALERGDWERAAALFGALEPRLEGHQRSLAVTRARRALALFELHRVDEAREALRLALPRLPADDPELQVDRFDALVTLGRIAERGLDYPAARELFRAAMAVPLPDIDKLGAYRGLVQTQLFDDTQAALAGADAALAIAAAAPGNRRLEAQIHSLRGRALLNLGRHAEARQALETAMRQLGNLTLRVDQADLIARSDLALASLLVGNRAEAKRYLAYTGAGRFRRGYLNPHWSNELPACGDGVAPDDVAVIEFSVLDDGRVGHAAPVYVSRPGPAALVFARAVAGWSFNREAAADVPPLLRSVSRVELRCSRAGPFDWNSLAPVEQSWRTLRPRPLVGPGLYRRPVDALVVELGRLERAPDADPLALLDVLLDLGTHPGLEPEQRAPHLAGALALADSANLPPALIAAIAFRLASTGTREQNEGFYAAVVATPAVAARPEAVSAIRLLQARSRYEYGDTRRALELVSEARAMRAVQADETLRMEGAELLALIHDSRGDTAAARAALAEIEPGARCRLAPQRRGTPGVSSDFPDEAARWGFEGWAWIETDIDPAGRPSAVRTVAAYPAFVFGDAAAGIMRRARFDRASSAAAAPCVRRTPVAFRLQG